MCGMMETFNGVLRGMGASLVALLVSVIGVCGVRLVWIFTVFRSPSYHSLNSLYFSYDISWFMCIAAQIIAIAIVYKKQKRILCRE